MKFVWIATDVHAGDKDLNTRPHNQKLQFKIEQIARCCASTRHS